MFISKLNQSPNKKPELEEEKARNSSFKYSTQTMGFELEGVQEGS